MFQGSPRITINNRHIGHDYPAYIIADIGINHNGILEDAYRLIDVSADAHVDAVKFQIRNLPNLYIKKYLDNPNSCEKGLKFITTALREFSLPNAAFSELKEYATGRGLDFLCTAFDIPSVHFVKSLDVPGYKISSSDLTNFPLISQIIRYNKPIVLSTGMCRFSELEETVRYLRFHQASFALLHCNSTYPVSFDNVNLLFLKTLEKFGCPVGYSGHEHGIAISAAAVALGARIIERHITLDRSMEGPDHAASLEPPGLAKLVRDIRNIESALGSEDEKYFTRGEMLNREILGKSLWSRGPIHKGQAVSREMVQVRCPGIGLSPQKIASLVGTMSKRDIPPDEPFLVSDIEDVPEDPEVSLVFRHPYGLVGRPKDIATLAPLHPGFVEIHLTAEDISHIGDMGKYGFPIIYHAPEFWDRNLLDLCSADPGKRKKSVEFIRGVFNSLADAPLQDGKRIRVVVHPGAMTLDHPTVIRETLQNNFYDSLEKIKDPKIEIFLENLPPRPWYFGGQWYTNFFMDAREIASVLRETGASFCYDTSHHKLYCNSARADFLEQVKILKPYISYVHISDASGIDGEGLQVGEGSIPWQDLFTLLEDNHYEFVPEIWRGHQNNNQGFRIALNRLKHYTGI